MRSKVYKHSSIFFMLSLLILFSCNGEGGSGPIAPPPPDPIKFTISTSSGVGGTITETQRNINKGQSVKIIAKADQHYQLKEWTGDCGTFNKNTLEITITASKNCSVNVSFEKIKYSITATSSDGGSVNDAQPSSSVIEYKEHGQTVSFTANPEKGYQLSGWTTAEDSECPELIAVENKVTFTVAGDCSLEAVFTKAPRTIMIEKNDPMTELQNGEIIITPSENVAYGDEVMVTATANEHYTFKGWSGNCGDLDNDESSITITILEDCTIGAVFEKVSYTVTAKSSEGGSVVRDRQQPHDGEQNTDEELSIVYGETAKLTAIPDKGYQLTEWRSENCPLVGDATEVEVEFMVEGNCSLEAVFEKASRMITIEENDSLTGMNNGKITITPSENVAYGDEVTITATPNEHYVFKGWSGDCGDLDNDESSITITILEDCMIGAVFEKVSYAITTASSEGGKIYYQENRIQEQLTIEYGQNVILSAIPDKGYQLTEWTVLTPPENSDGETSSVNCLTLVDNTKPEIEFTVEGNCSLKAVFEQRAFTLTISFTEGGSVSDTESGQEYGYGEEISLMAIPEKGYVFKEWEIMACPDNTGLSTPELTFTITDNCSLRAVFETKSIKISVPNQTEQGTKNDPIMGITNGKIKVVKTENPDSPIVYGDRVTITAIPDEHYEFKGWEGDCIDEKVSENPITITVTEDCQINPVFNKISYVITVEADSGGRINNGRQEIDYGDRFEVNATPDNGYAFERWTSDGKGCPDNLDTTYSIASFQVIGDCHLVATFTFTGEYTEEPEQNNEDEQQTTQQPNNPPTNNQPPTNQNPVTNQPTTQEPNDPPTDNQPTTEMPNDPPPPDDPPADPCPNPLYVDANGIIKAIECARDLIGQETLIDSSDESSQKYFIADEDALRNLVANDENLQYVNTTFVTDMSRLFKDKQNTNGDITKWDTSNVTRMDEMFYGTTTFNQDIGDWNVPKVTTMAEMFRGATTFNQDIGDWNVSEVTTMAEMFRGATTFNQDIGDWNVSKVTTMAGMFHGATSFNQDIGDWNVSEVTTMARMFRGATSFNGALNDWDVSSVTNMRRMFDLATSFNQPLNDWDVSNVTDMYEMFFDAHAFSQDISEWDVSSVTCCSGFWYWSSGPKDFRTKCPSSC